MQQIWVRSSWTTSSKKGRLGAEDEDAIQKSFHDPLKKNKALTFNKLYYVKWKANNISNL